MASLIYVMAFQFLDILEKLFKIFIIYYLLRWGSMFHVTVSPYVPSGADLIYGGNN